MLTFDEVNALFQLESLPVMSPGDSPEEKFNKCKALLVLYDSEKATFEDKASYCRRQDGIRTFMIHLSK